MKQPDRFARVVKNARDGYVSKFIGPDDAARLLRREQQAVKRKVMEMRNKDCKDKHYFYLLACDQILNWLEARSR